MDTLYIESSIVSYLRQRPTSDRIRAAWQVLTHRWWNTDIRLARPDSWSYVTDSVSCTAWLDDITHGPLLLTPCVTASCSRIPNFFKYEIR